jgi:hypothetical protein
VFSKIMAKNITEIFSSQNRQVFNVLMENKTQVYRKYLSCERVLMDEEANVI